MTRRIEALAEKKKTELDMIYYEKYSSLFDDAYTFLAKKKALLYGGTALNELMPTPYKFYDAYALADIDVLSPYAKQLAAEMVQFYRQHKHQATTFTEALHPGTYKVYSDGIQIADITQCSLSAYNMLLKTSVVGTHNIKIVPPQYMRMTLHKMLSQPNDAHRWSKVHERLHKFYKIFPYVSCPIKGADGETMDAMTEKIFSGMDEMVFFGKKEVGLLLDHKKPIMFPLPPILALTDQDLHKVVRQLDQNIPNVHVWKFYKKDDFVPIHAILLIDNRPIAIIFKLSSCVAFNQLKGQQRVAGIHTMLDMFLSMSMSHYPHFKKAKPFLECLSDGLTRVQQATINSRRKLFQQFGLVCHGPFMGVATLKVERVKRIISKKKNKKVFGKS